MHLGGFGFRQAKATAPAAFISSCNSTRQFHFVTPTMFRHLVRPTLQPQQHLMPHFLDTYLEKMKLTVILGTFFADFHKEVTTDLSSMSQKSRQSQIECSVFANLKESCSLQENARLNTASSIHATAWLREIPNPKLGLAMVSHEFLIAVKLWLGIPIFPYFPKAIWTYN